MGARRISEISLEKGSAERPWKERDQSWGWCWSVGFREGASERPWVRSGIGSIVVVEDGVACRELIWV